MDFNKNLRDLFNEKYTQVGYSEDNSANYVSNSEDFCGYFDSNKGNYGKTVKFKDGSRFDFVEGYTGYEDGSRSINFLIKYTNELGIFVFFNIKGIYSSWDDSTYYPEESYPLQFNTKEKKFMERDIYIGHKQSPYFGEWKEIKKEEQLELFEKNNSNESSWDDADNNDTYDPSSWE